MSFNFNRAFAIRHLPSDSIEFYFSRVIPNRSTVDCITNVVIEQLDPHVCVEPAPIRLEREVAHQLMDDLWSAGVRPTHAKAGDDLIQALRDHIVDSQAVRDALLKHFFQLPDN